MAAQNSEQEPSIEEILSSIRQIISDDDDAPAPAPPPPPPKEAFTPAPIAEDVIELTNKVEEKFSAAPEPEPIVVAMQEAADDYFEDPEPEPEPLPPPPPPRARPAPAPRTEDTDSLLTSRAEDAAYNGFSELARKTSIEYNGITLEEIVRTELKPLLRDWLDRNLPSIIERLVQEELERVAKRALED